MRSTIQVLRCILKYCVKLLNGLERVLALRAARLSGSPEAKLAQDALAVTSTEKHNMVTHPDEQFYARQYWHYLEKELSELPPSWDRMNCIDLGCGHGRMTIPLAEWLAHHHRGQVAGVDLSESALTFAGRLAREHGLPDGPLKFYQDDLLTHLESLPEGSVHLAVCLEVFFFLPSWREVIKEVSRVLVPGGRLLLAFRSRYYHILHAIRTGELQALPTLLMDVDGYPYGDGYFAWNTTAGMKAALQKHGLKTLRANGIGPCSGIEGDPLASIARPSELSVAELQQLQDAERQIGEELPDAGRYVLITAAKEG